MAASVSITSVVNEATTGDGQRILVNFSGFPGQLEFQSLDQFVQWAREAETQDLAARLACARMVALSPDLTNTAQVVGKACTLDFAQVNIFRIQ